MFTSSRRQLSGKLLHVLWGTREAPSAKRSGNPLAGKSEAQRFNQQWQPALHLRSEPGRLAADHDPNQIGATRSKILCPEFATNVQNPEPGLAQEGVVKYLLVSAILMPAKTTGAYENFIQGVGRV